MRLYAINTGNFKLDGGAMFGVVPKSIWSKTNSPDKNNMIDIAARCLLIQDEDKLILIDCGMGNKQSEKFFSYYYRWGEQGVDKALLNHGFHKDDVTDVFLTHLHFDHCGGGVEWNQKRTGFQMTFKNARYWSNAQHWNWAVNPNKRDWGVGQIQSMIKSKVTVNFENAGKVVINSKEVYLEKINKIE